MRLWIPILLLLLASRPAACEVRLEAISHVGASGYDDQNAGGIELVNKGDPVRIADVILNNREGCTLKIYDPDTVLNNALYGLRNLFVLSDEQATMVGAIAKANGKFLRPGPIELQTGDRVLLIALAVLPSGFMYGVPGGQCGNALVRLTIETDHGDYSWEW